MKPYNCYNYFLSLIVSVAVKILTDFQLCVTNAYANSLQNLEYL